MNLIKVPISTFELISTFYFLFTGGSYSRQLPLTLSYSQKHNPLLIPLSFTPPFIRL